MNNKDKQNSFKSASGSISYGQNITGSIITLATKEINGVASLHGKGVRMDFVGKTINVDIYINIFFGFSCCDVAYRIQENVKRAMETMSQYKIGTININIMGVNFRTEEVDNQLS